MGAKTNFVLHYNSVNTKQTNKQTKKSLPKKAKKLLNELCS